MKFKMFEDTTKIKDSMQLDSGTDIAKLTLDNGKVASVEVRGEVKVFWDDESSPYTSPSDFPKPLEDLIANSTTDDPWFENPHVYIESNNWFELFYDNNTAFVDNCECVDIERATPKEVYETIAELVNYAEEKDVLPKKYEDFCKSNEVVLHFEEINAKKVKTEIER